MSKLVIVESPTKARTIGRFLSKNFQLESSFGHIRDLPRSTFGVDIEHNFEPRYLIPVKSRKTVKHLKSLVPKSETVILATDEDREGEAIAWHLIQALGLKEADTERIVFHEITKTAINEALQRPRRLDMNLVDAQQARRVLDRIVGYKLSPFLWKKIARRLSAGRVQSVALRLIVERENEIKAFKSQEYWTILALLKSPAGGMVEANLIKIGNKILNRLDIKTKQQAEEIKSDLRKADYQIISLKMREVKRNPSPPFTTSTLQQAAASRLLFSAKKTMFVAQQLYEKGYITYMRTDSVNLSQESAGAAKDWLEKNIGKKYASQAPRFFKTKTKAAQEAHEAIRPTNISEVPEKVNLTSADEKKLYRLIWQRFAASQMPQAVFANTIIDIKADRYLLRATGNMLKFDGYLKIWPQKFEEKELPEVKENDPLDLQEIKASQHFTEPPPRYTEASLVKTLEEYGIGRPSTYASIVSVIQERQYVEKENRHFFPTDIGERVDKILTEHFPKIIDINFTAELENDLDKIAAGEKKWQQTVKSFYDPFIKNLEDKYEKVASQKMSKSEPEKTDEVCEKCSKSMVIRTGKFGKFVACSGFPDCRNTKKLESAEEPAVHSTGFKCPTCSEGDIVQRFARKGKRKFWGCSRYPKCDYATWDNPEK